MKIDGHIAPVVYARKTGTNIKIHVRQIAVLGITRAHANGSRIAVLNFNIDIAHR